MQTWRVRLAAGAAAARYKLGRVGGRRGAKITDLASSRATIEPAGREVAALLPFFADRDAARVLNGYEGAPREAALADVRRTTLGLGPVEAFTIRGAYLFGDAVYAPGAMHLLHRQQRPRDVLRGADVASMPRAGLCGTYAGARWFGHFVHDDLPLQYELERHAPPVLHRRPLYAHEPGYREVLGLPLPPQFHVLRAEELVMLNDVPQSRNKTLRYGRMRESVARSLAGVSIGPRRGLFVLRGTTGSRRVLLNEADVARRLEREGFRVVDPAAMNVREILAAFAAADVVCGVEGSQLLPAFIASPAGAMLAPINPPTRTVVNLPSIGAFFGLNCAVLVGEPSGAGDDFTIDPEDVVRSIDEARAGLAKDPNRAQAFVERVLSQAH